MNEKIKSIVGDVVSGQPYSFPPSGSIFVYCSGIQRDVTWIA